MSRGGRDAGILRDQEATQTVGMPGEPRGFWEPWSEEAGSVGLRAGSGNPRKRDRGAVGAERGRDSGLGTRETVTSVEVLGRKRAARKHSSE